MPQRSTMSQTRRPPQEQRAGVAKTLSNTLILSNCHCPWSVVVSERRPVPGRTSAHGGSDPQTVRSGAGARECVAAAGGAGRRSPLRASRGRRVRRTRRGADRVRSGDVPAHVVSGQPPPPPPAPPPALCSSAFAPRHGRAALAGPSHRLRADNLIPRSCGHRRGSPPLRRRRRRRALVRPAQSRARKWRRVSE